MGMNWPDFVCSLRRGRRNLNRRLGVDLCVRTSLPDDVEDITLLAEVHTGEIDCCTLQFLQ